MAFNDGTIEDNDVPEMDIDVAAEQLLKRWKGASSETSQKEAPKAAPKVAPIEEEEEDEYQEDEDRNERDEGEEEEEAEEKPAPKVADDEHEVVVEVDGQQHRVPVKDLKRLFGQEASITRKSQEVSHLRSQVEEQGTFHITALKSMIERAEERYKPFREIDWALAAAKLSDEDYQSLKNSEQTLKGDIDYYKTELGQTVDTLKAKATEATQQAAQQCVAAITNPDSPAYIEGWNEALYNDIRTYAADQGIPRQVIDQVVDPVSIKMVHKAMLYDKAQKTAVKKLTTAPRNVNKTPTNDGNSASSGSRQAMDRLRKSGDTDDAMAALLARWR
jgi:hypothetical protein